MKDILRDLLYECAQVYLLCRIVWDCRCNWMIYGGIFIWYSVIYVNIRVIYIHFLFLSIWKSLTNAQYFCIYSKRVYVVGEMIFVRSLPVQVWWSTLYKTRNFCLIILPVVIIDVSGSMILVKAKDFVVFWPWMRI